MSGSETGAMTSREPFSVGVQNTPLTVTQQNMRLTFSADGTAVYKPITPPSPTYQSSAAGVSGHTAIEGSAGGSLLPHGLNTNAVGSEQIKRKRGRPRKYAPDGSMASPLSSAPLSATVTQSSGGFSLLAGALPALGGLASPNSLKKTKGRPPGSKRKQQLEALGSAGIGFTPHLIHVKSGENGPRAVCILSANGAISNVTLRQPATSGGTVTYEGRFEILSLSGSFLLSENGGQRSRTGGLSVSLSGPDGRVLGGGVAGLLMAASPVQVVVGSFLADGGKELKSARQTVAVTTSPKLNSVGGAGDSSPSHESSGSPESPLNNSSGGTCNPQGMSGMLWK